MTTNYKKGVTFEHNLVKILKEILDPKKYTIIRTAGSHSPVDVLIIEHRGVKAQKGFSLHNRAFGIQCKSTKEKTSPREIERFKEKYS